MIESSRDRISVSESSGDRVGVSATLGVRSSLSAREEVFRFDGWAVGNAKIGFKKMANREKQHRKSVGCPEAGTNDEKEFF